MGTVDKKAFLTAKVTAGGIVNTDRAVVAAEMSNTMTIDEAVARAKTQVKDVPSVKSNVNADVVVPVPLYPMFR